MQTILITITFIALLATTACSPHKLTIQQGNPITEDKLAMLKTGMEEAKVQFILGTPPLRDSFNKDRWDYYYSLEVDGEEVTKYRASLYFKMGKLERIEKKDGIPGTEGDAQKTRAVLQE